MSTDRVNILCDLAVDHLVQERKNTRISKDARLILTRDEWGNIILVVRKKSGKMSYKKETSSEYTQTTENQERSELETPHILLMASNIKSTTDLDQFLSILHKIESDPRHTDEIELFKDGEEEEDHHHAEDEAEEVPV